MLYKASGPTVQQGGYTYPAANVDGVMVADAYVHDDEVLPHQVPGDLNLLFPRAVAAPEFPEISEPQDTLEKVPEHKGRGLTKPQDVRGHHAPAEGASAARREKAATSSG